MASYALPSRGPTLSDSILQAGPQSSNPWFLLHLLVVEGSGLNQPEPFPGGPLFYTGVGIANLQKEKAGVGSKDVLQAERNDTVDCGLAPSIKVSLLGYINHYSFLGPSVLIV